MMSGFQGRMPDHRGNSASSCWYCSCRPRDCRAVDLATLRLQQGGGPGSEKVSCSATPPAHGDGIADKGDYAPRPGRGLSRRSPDRENPNALVRTFPRPSALHARSGRWRWPMSGRKVADLHLGAYFPHLELIERASIEEEDVSAARRRAGSRMQQRPATGHS